MVFVIFSILSLLASSRPALAADALAGFYLDDGMFVNGERAQGTPLGNDKSDQTQKIRATLTHAPDLSLIQDLETHVLLYPLVGSGNQRHFDFEGTPRDGGLICSDDRQTQGQLLVCLQKRIQSYGSEVASMQNSLSGALQHFNATAAKTGAPPIDLNSFWSRVNTQNSGWGTRIEALLAHVGDSCGGNADCVANARAVRATMRAYEAKMDIFSRAAGMQDRLWRDSNQPPPAVGLAHLPASGLVIQTDAPTTKKTPTHAGSGSGSGTGRGNGSGSASAPPPAPVPIKNPSPALMAAARSMGADGIAAARAALAQNAKGDPSKKGTGQDAAPDGSDPGATARANAGSGSGGGGGERKVRSPTDPLVDLSFFGMGASHYYPCPDFAAKFNCFPTSGVWAPNASGQPISGTQVSAQYDSLKPLLFQMLAEHAVKAMAEGYVTAIASTNPDTFASTAGLQGRINEFMSSASCLSEGAQKDLRKQLDGIVLPQGQKLDELKATMRLRRDLLGTDLHGVSRKLSAAKETTDRLAPRFENGGDCGFIAMRLNSGAFGDPNQKANSDCQDRFVELQQARATTQESFANYPFLALTIPADDGTPVWKLIADANDASGARALSIYDSEIGQTSAAALKRVHDICDDPQKEGKAAMLNPVIAQSFFADPRNQGAAWVYCAAYSQNARNDELVKIAKTGFIMATVVCTGGTAGVLLGAGVVGMTVYDNFQKYDQLQRDKNDYLAGTGNVDTYLEARDGLNHFWRNASVEVGLASLALVPGVGMLKSWMQARKLAKLGQIAELDAATASKLLGWYRTRAIATLGNDARNLSDAELLTMARAESTGSDISALRKGAGCIL